MGETKTTYCRICEAGCGLNVTVEDNRVTNVEPDKEALFNEVYDREHVPLLTQVPGVVAVHRFVSEPFELSIGGEIRRVDSGEPKYSAVYELESPDVLTGSAWASGQTAPT